MLEAGGAGRHRHERRRSPATRSWARPGTAQIPAPGKDSYIPGAFMASFVGFAPAANPVLRAIVVLDRPDADLRGDGRRPGVLPDHELCAAPLRHPDHPGRALAGAAEHRIVGCRPGAGHHVTLGSPVTISGSSGHPPELPWGRVDGPPLLSVQMNLLLDEIDVLETAVTLRPSRSSDRARQPPRRPRAPLLLPARPVPSTATATPPRRCAGARSAVLCEHLVPEVPRGRRRAGPGRPGAGPPGDGPVAAALLRVTRRAS